MKIELPDTPDNTLFTTDNIVDITIISEIFGSISIYPQEKPHIGGSSIFSSISVKESLFSPVVSGKLLVNDIGNFIDNYNIQGFEDIIFSFRKKKDGKIYTFAGIITDVTLITNDSTLALKMNPSEYVRLFSLTFMNKDLFVANNITPQTVKKDWIGWISRKNSPKIPSFIHKFFKRNDFIYDPNEIEDASNGAWIKYDNISNPYGISLFQSNLIQLFAAVTKNAVSVDKKKVNFLLWSDIESFWHFKTADSFLINEPVHTIISNPILNIQDKITNIVVNSSSDNISSLENKIFYSSYKRTDPDYTKPYLDFTDTESGMTKSNVIYNYNDSFNYVKHLYNNPLITDLTFPIKSSSLSIDPPVENLITNIVTTDFGYFDSSPYNTDTPVWWDYLGKENNKYNNVTWQPQHDISDINFENFYKFHTEIRMPLIERRMAFARMKNIKRKWETYRCVVCCMDQPIGSAEDIQLLRSIYSQPPLNVVGIDGTIKSYDIGDLFGKNGLFVNKPDKKDYLDIGSSVGLYEIVAAGSFNDHINYTGLTTDQNGLTWAIDPTKGVYNESIGRFYNLAGNGDIKMSEYYSRVITGGLAEYDKKISENQSRINDIKVFGNKVDSWIDEAITYIGKSLVPCSQCIENRDKNDVLIDVNNYWTAMRHMSNKNLPEYKTTYPDLNKLSVPCGYKPEYGGPDIFVWAGTGVTSQGLTAFGPVSDIEGIGKIPYFRIPQYSCLKTINFDENWKKESNNVYKEYKDIYDALAPGVELNFGPTYDIQFTNTKMKECYTNTFMRGSDAGITYKHIGWKMKEKCVGNTCYNEYCFNPNILYALKEIAVLQLNMLNIENYLLLKVKNKIQSGLVSKLKTHYNEYWNRPAFFYSKTPGTSIFKGNVSEGFRGKTLSQPLSLYGVKKITRKPIRGSRYEILSKARGIEGASMGEWLYNIWFEGENAQTYSYKNLNPYYSQNMNIQGNNDLLMSKKFQTKIINSRLNYYSIQDNAVVVQNKEFKKTIISSIPSVIWTSLFNQTQGLPPNIKREQIASYVRVELEVPIGLDRIKDFPDGFVRDMGSEYFLPYIVSLTAGPSGRQTIRNNAVVIGMDPYGFDVAVKKGKIESKYDQRNDWSVEGGNPELTQTELTRNGMDLWPEPMFETKYPYYAEDPRQMWSYSDSYTKSDISSIDRELPKMRSAEVDAERRKTAMGSGILLASHRKIKPHRSWWAFHFPKNIFIPQKIYSMLDTDLSTSFRHGNFNITNLPGDPFDGWLNFLDDDQAVLTTIMTMLQNTKFN